MKSGLNGVARHDTTAEEHQIDLCWRMRAPTGRLLMCGLYQTADGLELRAGYAGDDPMWAEAVPSKEAGVMIAAAWKEVVAGKGGFVDLDPPH
jgi:hypothetical protein